MTLTHCDFLAFEGQRRGGGVRKLKGGKTVQTNGPLPRTITQGAAKPRLHPPSLRQLKAEVTGGLRPKRASSLSPR